MRKIARLLSFLSAILSGLTLLRPSKDWPMWLMLPKPFAAAMTPLLAVAGGLGALLGLLHRDRRAVRAGLFGAVVSLTHVKRVTAPHDGFAAAFGPDWHAQIPAGLQARMLPKRFIPLPPDPPSARWQQDVVVGTHVESGDPLLADLWQPPEDVPPTGLAAIYLHGSGWHYADKDFGTRRFFHHLASQGHVIVDLAYTLAPQARLKAMVADVKRAIAWAKENGSEYGVSPERIVLMGGSAGAHLALLAGYTPNHPELQPADVETDTSVHGVISFYGFPDIAAAQDHFQEYHGDWMTGKTAQERRLIERITAYFHRVGFLPPDSPFVSAADMLPGLIGGGPEEAPELYALGSPIRHVGPHCPPTLQLQGAHDVGGMMDDVRRLHQALRAAGVPSVWVEFPNTDHGFDLFLSKWSPAAQAATHDVERFLALMI
ncbi:MAG: alpha/beta hydrolase [Anaerolineae bacterium]|nr:alpha/beta hydrolase [Anaerolineae bacterium]